MACFIVPTLEAIATTAATRAVRRRELASLPAEQAAATGQPAESGSAKSEAVIPFSRKLGWLNKLLWGGSALLAFEHVWHGEVVPWFPFLTAAADPSDRAAMLHEMATVGVSMALLVTAAWGFMLLAAHVLEKRSNRAQADADLTRSQAGGLS
ncbi:hypothetical protein HCH52_03375 [Oscillospiraceae bacterium HV4-5-C5C]|nr:hypothetical protein [Oscillospiraceae bacterium HV4-5-C5C]